MTIEEKIPRAQLHSPENESLAKECGVPLPLAAILRQRGIRSAREAHDFLHPDASQMHSPFLMKDMDKAARRVIDALLKGEKILIFGDYDVDGISATALLYLYLSAKGASLSCRLPERLEEGYGLSAEVLGEYTAQGVTLLITVDTGCTAVEEVALAARLSMDAVVTDHHECRDVLPQCAAVVDPMRKDCTYPFKGLAGVGVAFKLICAVEILLTEGAETEDGICRRLLDQYGDIVVLGTVADVMPMIDENRVIVKTGLARLSNTGRPGLEALLKQNAPGKAKRELTTSTIGFSIAPKLNAAGRMRSPIPALQLLLTDSPEKAAQIAEELSALNAERQEEEKSIFHRAEEIIARGGYENDRVLVLFDEGWHPGVIGIVASRIVEKYKKAAFLITDDKTICKGSCRSVKGVDLTALLAFGAPLLEKFGGHTQAAGFSLKRENIDAFRKAVNEAALALPPAPQQEACTVETTLSPNELTLPFAESLQLLEPCGRENPVPVFAMENAEVAEIFELSFGKHSKLILEKEGVRFTALQFGTPAPALPVVAGDTVLAVFEAGVNEYMGACSVQMLLRAVCPDGQTKKERETEKAVYRSLLSRSCKENAAQYLPDRSDFAGVYRALLRLAGRRIGKVSLRYLAHTVLADRQTRCAIVLAVFAETGLVTVSGTADEDVFLFTLNDTGKIDLAASKILQTIKSQI